MQALVKDEYHFNYGKKLNIRVLLALCCFMMIFPTLLKANQNNTEYNKSIVDSLKKELLQDNHPDSIKFKLLLKLSYQLETKSPYEALSYVKQAYQLAKTDWEKAIALYQIALIYRIVADYSNALFYNFQALQLYEQLGSYNRQVRILGDIATCYIDLRKFPLAEKFLNMAIILHTQTGNNNDIAVFYSNLGIIRMQQGHLYKAIYYYKKAIELNKKAHSNHEVAIPINNLGDTYARLKKYDTAEYYYKQALINVANDRERIGVHISLGELYTNLHQFDKAAHYLLEAKNLAENSPTIGIIKMDVLYTIAIMYEAQKDFRNANIYYKKYHALKNSAMNEKAAKQINEIQAKYEINKKDQELQIAEAKVSREQLLKNILIIAFITGLIIIIILYRNIWLKREVNKILSERSKQLELQKNQIETKNQMLNNENISARFEVLKSKTNPHFLFNSLNALSSIVKKDQQQAIEYIEHFSALYRTILKTGDQFIVSLAEELVLVNNYIYLQKMQFGNKLITNFDIKIDSQKNFVPQFAIQMIVENAIKHNAITRLRNLKINIETDGQSIIISNNLQKKRINIASTAVGQKSITDRYALLVDDKPIYIETPTEYIVILPLLDQKYFDITNKNRQPHTENYFAVVG